MNNIIIIGGSDPSGGAGIQADLFTLNPLGLTAKSVITSVTAQNEKKFISYEAVSSQNFQDQLRSLEEFSPQAIIKIGMLGHHRFIPLLQNWLSHTHPSFVILDPVFLSSTGAKLLDVKGIQMLPELFPLIDLLTPNVSEAEALSGVSIQNPHSFRAAGELLLKNGPKNILLKGGHLPGNTRDVLMNSELEFVFEDKRIPSHVVHGTGCTLASAIAAYLSLGNDLVESVRLARKVVREKIKNH